MKQTFLLICYSIASYSSVTAEEFSIDLGKASSGFDGKSCWVHARAGIIPASLGSSADRKHSTKQRSTDSHSAQAVMTTQKLLLSGSDVFYALHQMNSADGGKTWSKPVAIDSFGRQTYDSGQPSATTGALVAPELLASGDQTTVCDFTPAWHAKTQTLLGIGQTVWYRNNKVMHLRPRGIAYSVMNPRSSSKSWSAWKCVDLPEGKKFQCAGSGSQQRVDLPDGDVLLPVYLKEPHAKQYASVVMRCRFDGKTLSYIEHGNELTIPVDRGLYEPSITQFDGNFFLTLRNDRHGYVARSSDGLHYETPVKWTFDDGSELGNYNTQQHWVTHGNDLYLVYTRRGAANDHVFRHRAPLFIAKVNADTLQVIRKSERVVVPERGARLGNFGVTRFSDDETWITVTEWMQPVGVEKYGSDNTIWVAKLKWQTTTSDSDNAARNDLPRAPPEAVQMDGAKLSEIDEVVAEGIRDKKMPGCVVLIGRKGRVVYHKAFGHRQLVPEKRPMEIDTVFDMASLTKPIATATSVMKLVEDGEISLDATVATYLPEFGANGKDKITVRQLLTHSGGLIPDNSIKDYANGPQESFRKINALGTYVEPGTKFVYTDVGFIVLAEVVRKLSGKDIHEYSRENIFEPLEMTETGYLPNDVLRKRAAVTQTRNGKPMQGEVHDPRAYALDGVAGHAGLFSTAQDLAKYCQMALNGGSLGKATILKPQTVELMTAPQTVSSGLRTLGWDMKSPYSSNRGESFSDKAFGHGGFTGTAMWIDPGNDLFVIFLSNRVHPNGKGSVNRIAGKIGTIAGNAILNVTKQ